jgi:YidC/Oxa1 family membrane protein insertase
MTDNRNLILAVILSVAVVFGWQYFVAGPKIDQTRQHAAQTSTAAQTTSGSPTSTPGAEGAATTPGAPNQPAQAAVMTRDQALAASPRVAIDTPSVTGSINLKGARLDDLHLDGFRETVDPKSPTIVLLSPSGAPNGYFAEFGWVAPAGVAAPGPDTLWTAPAGAKLTETTPVTLTWDNGAGLTFKRTVSVDPRFMFTVKDEVTNATGEPVAMSPYGRVVRLGEPVVAGYYILHEGPLGVLGEKGLQEITYKNLRKAGSESFQNIETGWLGITDKYWAAAVIPR